MAFSDETEPPKQPSGTTTGDSDEPSTTDEKELGFILDEQNEEKVAKHIIDLRTQQEPLRARNRATWKRNRWWREGKRFVRLEKKENSQAWEAKLPAGMGSSPPVPNKTDRLCRRLVNTIWVDPAYPECEPGDASPEAADAAEFATRYLAVKGSPSDLNMEQICRSALDKAMTYASAFAWVVTDPTGGGHRPRQIVAHPAAQSQDEALQDPETGQPAGENDLVDRYLRADGSITDSPTEADLQWLPGPRVRLLTGLNVDMLPETARNLRDAVGVLITDTTTLGDLRAQFSEAIEGMSEDDLQKLCSWRPDRFKDLLPAYSSEPDDQKEEGGTFKDSQTVVTVTCYYRRCSEYPLGAYAVVGGEKFLLYRQKWAAMFPQSPTDNGDERPDQEETLEIPVAQNRCIDDNTFDNPYGIAMAEQLGPADEVRASALGYEMEYMFRFGNPQAFIPMGSIVQPKQLMMRDGTPIMTNPNGNVFYENVPSLPNTVPQLRAEMGHEMDDESGLQQAAQGVEDPSVNSGIHAQTIVQEALKAVGHIRSNSAFFYIDLNRILLEQARAFGDVPQLISYVGEDGQYKEREWSRTSFKNTKNVTISRGSFTMHTLVAKQQMANEALDRQAISMEDYKELISGGVSPVLGMQDDPHLLRIRRQLEIFSDGPPEGWMEAIQALQMAQQQAEQVNAQAQQMAAQGVDPMSMGLQPPQLPPKPPGPFDDHLPIDLEPIPAKIRHRQLSKQMASQKYQAFDPMWQAELLNEYGQMKNAAGVMTVPETQQAQQQGLMPGQQQQGQQPQQAPFDPATQPTIGPNGEVMPAGLPQPLVPVAPPVTINMPDTSPTEIIHRRNARGEIISSMVVPAGMSGMMNQQPDASAAKEITHRRNEKGEIVSSLVAPVQPQGMIQ